jgi:hypothetical protein
MTNAVASMFMCAGLSDAEEAKVMANEPAISQRLFEAGVMCRICKATSRNDERVLLFHGFTGVSGYAVMSEFMSAKGIDAMLKTIKFTPAM